MAQQIQVRRDSAADWTSAAPTLADGEIGFETDTGKFKIGDGATAWASLDYFDPNAGVSDGDKGDVTVSSSGTVWTIDNGAVTAAKVAADVATQAELDAVAAAAQPLASVLTNTTASFTTADETKLDGIEAAADVTDATNVDAAGAVMNSDTSTAAMSFVVDEDTMSSNSATKVPTQQSVKAYVDSTVGTYPASPVNVTPFMTPQASSGWDAPVASASNVFGGYRQNAASPAIGNSISFDAWLAIGTWEVGVMGVTANDFGIVTLTLDGVALASLGASGSTLDWYTSGSANNVAQVITGIAIPTAGLKRLKIEVTSKHASSSNYRVRLQHIQFRRTGN